ncbi:MAG: hypothetical protein LC732_04680 [Acidobacteria bacterium]|nr:hypothetical protein [Acidobacteriota bacterium]
MTRLALMLTLLVLLAAPASGVEPEECLVAAGSEPATTADYRGVNYELASAECRELFLSDPERYSQLFDALAELGAQPAEPAAHAPASLVPN